MFCLCNMYPELKNYIIHKQSITEKYIGGSVFLVLFFSWRVWGVGAGCDVDLGQLPEAH